MRRQLCTSNHKLNHNSMENNEFYPEEVLIAKLESGEYGWLDYVNHYSSEWQDEYIRYCQDNSRSVGDASAAAFVQFKDEQLEAAMENGDA